MYESENLFVSQDGGIENDFFYIGSAMFQLLFPLLRDLVHSYHVNGARYPGLLSTAQIAFLVWNTCYPYVDPPGVPPGVWQAISTIASLAAVTLQNVCSVFICSDNCCTVDLQMLSFL